MKGCGGDVFGGYGGYGTIPFGIVRHLDKAKSSRLTRLTVGDDGDPINFAVGFKQRPNVLFSSSKTEVSNKNTLHRFSFRFESGATREGEKKSCTYISEAD